MVDHTANTTPVIKGAKPRNLNSPKWNAINWRVSSQRAMGKATKRETATTMR